MSTTKNRNDVFENFAKEMGATFSTNPNDLSPGQRDLMQGFASMLRDMNTPDAPLLTPAEKFHLLAEKYDLSVDDGDIELFLTVELSRIHDETKITQKILASDTALRNQATEQALDRVFAGIEHTEISRATQRTLRASATDAASEILDNFNPAILKDHAVNVLRDDLMGIYERFLLWMRIARDGLLSLNIKKRQLVEKLMTKMIELLNACYMLNQSPLPENPIVRKMLVSGEARFEYLVEYGNALKELEKIMPTGLKASRSQATRGHDLDDTEPWLD